MKQPLRVQGYLNQIVRHLEASCFQQGIDKKKGFHYEERDLFSSYSPLKRNKGDRSKIRLELSHLVKNFLLFTTCKIIIFLRNTFLLLGQHDRFGGKI